MFKHILVATDGSQLSEKAAVGAVQLAKSLSARLTAVTVSAPFHVFAADAVMLADTGDVYKDQCKAEAEKYLRGIQTAAESAGLGFEGVHAFNDHPYAAIIETAQQQGCDAICIASHGRRGIAALVLGSETMKVLTHSKIPVVVWR